MIVDGSRQVETLSRGSWKVDHLATAAHIDFMLNLQSIICATIREISYRSYIEESECMRLCLTHAAMAPGLPEDQPVIVTLQTCETSQPGGLGVLIAVTRQLGKSKPSRPPSFARTLSLLG
jgi:hypothetical protein